MDSSKPTKPTPARRKNPPNAAKPPPPSMPADPPAEGPIDGPPAKTGTSRRGFASLDPERHHEVSKRGGQRSQQQPEVQAARFSPERAKIAGRKGGLAVSSDRDHMVRIAQQSVAKRRGKT